MGRIDTQGPFMEAKPKPEAKPESESFGWPGVVSLALICLTVCFIVWVIWG